MKRIAPMNSSFVSFLSLANPGGPNPGMFVLLAFRLPPHATSSLEESQQVGVKLVFVRLRQAVGCAGVDFQRAREAVFDVQHRSSPPICRFASSRETRPAGSGSQSRRSTTEPSIRLARSHAYCP